MRLGLGFAAALLLVASGCVGPHSTGSLWVLQNTQLDAQQFRTSDAQKAANTDAYEVALAQHVIDSERARLEAGLVSCAKGDRQALVISEGDRQRDRARLWLAEDATAPVTGLADVALADWRLRRANATGQAALCDQARAALAGQVDGTASRSGLIDGLGAATVTRSAVQPFEGAVSAAWMLYGLGMVDAVTAPGPLPQYLAAVYGGTVNAAGGMSDADAQATVDRLAPAYPEWEPDALYAALRSGQSQ
jgi:hypothetical protein